MQQTYVLLRNTPDNILYWYKYTYWQEMKNYAKFIKKNYFINMFQFLLTLFIDIITPVNLFTQIACCVMCVQYEIH